MLLQEAVESYFRLAHNQTEDKGADLPDLLQRAAQGDKDAVNEVFLRYHDELLRVAKARAKNKADAEEVVQDLYVKLAETPVLQRFWAKVQTKQRVPADLISVLKTALINQLKNVHTKKSAQSLATDPSAKGGPGLSDADKQVVRTVLRRALEKAKLSDDERKFIELLIVSKEGEVSAPEHRGDIMTAAKQAGLKAPGGGDATNVQAQRVRDRFLKQFCNDKELRDLLPGGRKRTAMSSFFRKNIKAVCPESESDSDCTKKHGHTVFGRCIDDTTRRQIDDDFRPVFEFAAQLAEDNSDLTSDAASDRVLLWIAEQLSAE
jgi:DNA-directed RNA polymerase specialized sigma24 family protein